VHTASELIEVVLIMASAASKGSHYRHLMLAPLLVLLDSVVKLSSVEFSSSWRDFLAVKGRSRLLSRIGTVLQLGRVRFLVYSPIAYAAGVTCATANGQQFSIRVFVIGQVQCFFWVFFLLV
jgi:hypothetical protein